MRTVPVCALDSVDAATMISAAANMAAPNFMPRKNPSIVASQRLLLTSQLIKVREFSRPVEGVQDCSEHCEVAGVGVVQLSSACKAKSPAKPQWLKAQNSHLILQVVRRYTGQRRERLAHGSSQQARK